MSKNKQSFWGHFFSEVAQQTQTPWPTKFKCLATGDLIIVPDTTIVLSDILTLNSLFYQHKDHRGILKSRPQEHSQGWFYL